MSFFSPSFPLLILFVIFLCIYCYLFLWLLIIFFYVFKFIWWDVVFLLSLYRNNKTKMSGIRVKRELILVSSSTSYHDSSSSFILTGNTRNLCNDIHALNVTNQKATIHKNVLLTYDKYMCFLVYNMNTKYSAFRMSGGCNKNK